MRRIAMLLLAALLALLVAGCGGSNKDATGTISNSSAPSSQQSATASHSSEPTATPSAAQPDNGTADQALKEAAAEVILLLRDRDLGSLTEWIDPELGLRFSPYSHIDKNEGRIFLADELPDFKTADKLVWGTADGSGEPISLTFREYYDLYVYNQDFADAPTVSYNALVSQGNMTFNAAEVYPGSSFVEFHFPGFDEQFEGMDWQSLILVFVPRGEEWKLASIVHSQWTI